jgi:hypothetical protein
MRAYFPAPGDEIAIIRLESLLNLAFSIIR